MKFTYSLSPTSQQHLFETDLGSSPEEYALPYAKLSIFLTTEFIYASLQLQAFATYFPERFDSSWKNRRVLFAFMVLFCNRLQYEWELLSGLNCFLGVFAEGFQKIPINAL